MTTMRLLKAVSDRQRRLDRLIQELVQGIPVDRTFGQSSKLHFNCWQIFLAGIAGRNKVAWWEFFRLKALTEEELLDERAAISGLRL